MTSRQRFLTGWVVLALAALFFFTVFGSHGLVELVQLKSERDGLLAENRQLEQESRELSARIERLQKDLGYIESIARHELGMVGKDELIVRPLPAPQR